MTTTVAATCERCGASFAASGHGRPALYCSGRCRQAAHVARRGRQPARAASVTTAELDALRVEVERLGARLGEVAAYTFRLRDYMAGRRDTEDDRWEALVEAHEAVAGAIAAGRQPDYRAAAAAMPEAS